MTTRYTQDEITVADFFEHGQEFVTLEDFLEVVALAKTQFDIVKIQRDTAHEFLRKTAGTSIEDRYVKDPDYWHDLGWEKDLESYFKKYKTHDK